MNPGVYTTLQNKIRDSKEDNDYKSYDELYHLSFQRQNVLRWYPFENNKVFLHLGSEAGIITQYLCSLGTVYCVEEDDDLNRLNKLRNPQVNIDNSDVNSFLANYNQKADYIIVDGYLDRYDCKQEILEKCQSLLNDQGTIIILATNKLALKYFAGVEDNLTTNRFDNISKGNHLFSKKEWEELLTKCSLKKQFLYPYPNSTFSEYIFTKAPSESDLDLKHEDFEEYGVRFFDQSQAIKSISTSGYFEDFNNSFMIILNPKHSVSYVKFACERRDKFQIYTSITKENGIKKVIKAPIYECGKSHMEKMYEYYTRFNDYNTNDKISYCPVELNNNKLYFDFIEGVSLESLVQEDVNKGNIIGIEEKLEIINQLISIGNTCSFKINNRFIEVFGDQDYTLLNGLDCYEFNNIDLIFDNILVNDKYNVIDYEWVFDCKIPKSFIIFRTVFHSVALTLLTKEQINKLYEKYGINEELREFFMNMELNFQNYVSKFKLSEVYEKLDCVAIPYQKDLKVFREFFVYQNELKYKKKMIFDNRFQQSINIDSNQDIVIKLGDKAIIDLNDIQLNGKRVTELNTNASYVSNTTYYFDKKPSIEIKNDGAELLFIDFTIYYYGDDSINNIEDLTKVKDKYNKLMEHIIVRFIERRGK